MLQRILCILLAVICFGSHSINAQEAIICPVEGDFHSLSDADSLIHWVPLNVAADTFRVENGTFISSGFPTGLLRSSEMYENFELELDWRHMKAGGNAGVFIYSDALPQKGSPFARGIEVQILDNGFNIPGKNEWYSTHGDLFPVGGAKMTPAGRISPSGVRSFPQEERSLSSPEWNHYRLVANNGNLSLSINGKEVTIGHDCNPRKGYLCLESEGSECQFKNIRIKELQSTNPKPDEIAMADEGFRMIYNGINLDGWKQDPGHEGHWKPKDWILTYDGKSTAKDQSLWTVKDYKDVEMICDWRFTGKPVETMRPIILPSGEYELDADGKQKMVAVQDAGDSGIYLRGNIWSQVNMWCWPVGSGEVYGYRTNKKYSPEVHAGVTPRKKMDAPLGKWNRFHVKLIGDRLTVKLNGEIVIENAELPGVPEIGPIGLQHHGDAIEFANIFVKEIVPAEEVAP
jgi:hypothetical protein